MLQLHSLMSEEVSPQRDNAVTKPLESFAASYPQNSLRQFVLTQNVASSSCVRALHSQFRLRLGRRVFSAGNRISRRTSRNVLRFSTGRMSDSKAVGSCHANGFAFVPYVPPRRCVPLTHVGLSRLMNRGVCCLFTFPTPGSMLCVHGVFTAT